MGGEVFSFSEGGGGEQIFEPVVGMAFSVESLCGACGTAIVFPARRAPGPIVIQNRPSTTSQIA